MKSKSTPVFESPEWEIISSKPQAQQTNQIQLDFYEALREVANNKKITRLSWGDADIYGVMRTGILSLKNEKGFHQWLISDGDMSGEDWVAY